MKDSVKFFLIRRPDTFWVITWELTTVCRIQNYQSALNSHIHDRFVIAEGLPDCDGFDAAFMLISNELIDGLVRECVFRTKTASIPAGKRPPFRWENGRHSDVIAATIPVNSASV